MESRREVTEETGGWRTGLGSRPEERELAQPESQSKLLLQNQPSRVTGTAPGPAAVALSPLAMSLHRSREGSRNSRGLAFSCRSQKVENTCQKGRTWRCQAPRQMVNGYYRPGWARECCGNKNS